MGERKTFFFQYSMSYSVLPVGTLAIKRYKFVVFFPTTHRLTGKTAVTFLIYAKEENLTV